MSIDSLIETCQGKISYILNKKNIYNQDISNLKSVCLLLGPYRNLTTFTVSLLFLHPDVQVLNHGGNRVFKINDLNFLKNYSQKKFDNFCKFAVYTSQGGRKGDYGGSIRYSHAFSKSIMKTTYENRFGDSYLKDNIDCIVWKESLMVSNYLRKYNIDFQKLFDTFNKLRFLMPVRNPLDCTISNLRTGHVKRFAGSKKKEKKDVLEAILKEFSWFLKLHKKFPNKFFYFFQDELNETIFKRMASFLEIELGKKWIEDTISCVKIKKSYDYEKSFVEDFNKLVDKYFLDFPDFSKHLRKLI